MSGRVIFVAGGVTSSLFASLLPLLSDFTVYGTSRRMNDPKLLELEKRGVKFNADLSGVSVDRVLWFSTHDDTELLTEWASKVPTLAINSGAVLDILSGKQPENTANAYQKSKLALLQVPKLFNFIPGFFIQDAMDPDWASKGFHGDTTNTVFQTDFDEKFSWDKEYCVTPKSILVNLIHSWLTCPENFGAVTRVCSERPYKRLELRALSLEPFLDTSVEPQLTITHTDVRNACIKARLLVVVNK